MSQFSNLNIDLGLIYNIMKNKMQRNPSIKAIRDGGLSEEVACHEE